MAQTEWHRLTDIDPVERVAVCSVCGPVGIRSSGKGRGWRCRINANQHKGYKGEPRWRWGVTGYRRFVEPVCNDCGYTDENTSMFDVHHIDHDRSNNSPDNLVSLCPTCHRRRHIADRVTPPALTGAGGVRDTDL